MPLRPRTLRPSRRTILAGLGASALLPPLAGSAIGQTQARQSLTLRDTMLQLGSDQTETAAWRFDADSTNWRFPQGKMLELDLTNAITSPINLSVHGLDGAAGAVPLLTQPPIVAGKRESRSIPLTHAGTYLFDMRLGNESAARPLPCAAFAVTETTVPDVDRDEILLIEDWRLKGDGSAIAPLASAADTRTIYTINGRTDWTIPVRTNQRLRLRFVNGCHRMAIAFAIEGHEVQIMAIDGEPAEPFTARQSRFVLAPGTRLDTMLDTTLPPSARAQILLHDGTAPRQIATLQYAADPPARATPRPPPAALPGNGLPSKIPLASAQRSTLAIGAAGDTDWVAAERISTQLAPMLRVKRGRSVVLAITNRAAMPVTFHMHGHHFRLLDRLDDGWKPFWLDTLLLDAGQTQRIAFLAEHRGNWLVEAMGIEWGSPRLLRWFAVE